MPTKRLAVLIDAENIGAQHYQLLHSEIRKLGDPKIFRLFGDFSTPILSPWLKLAKEHSLETEFQISGGKGKNSTDMLMTVHAMDILHAGIVEGLCLVSSDRDFVPLVTRLKASRMSVHGFGADTGNARLRKACDSFFPLKNVPKPIKPKSITPTQADVNEIMTAMQTIIANKGENGWIGLAIAASALRQNHSQVADKVCGKGKFLKNLRKTDQFTERGKGTTIEVCLKAS